MTGQDKYEFYPSKVHSLSLSLYIYIYISKSLRNDNFYLYNILTSDLAELSNEKCTCVNNRCIRSKISEDNLDYGWVELGADMTLTEAGGC